MRRISLAVIVLLLILGCTSRYRLDFFVTEDGKRNKVKVLQREFILRSQLNDPYAEDKIVAGDGNTMLITLNIRGARHATEYGAVLGYDESLRYRLYVHLDGEPQNQTVSLPDNSLLYLVGRYDLPAEAKVYLPQGGQMVVDSVRKDHMFATINGQFANKAGETLAVDGRLRVKVKP